MCVRVFPFSHSLAVPCTCVSSCAILRLVSSAAGKRLFGVPCEIQFLLPGGSSIASELYGSVRCVRFFSAPKGG